jgi:hypothetical protein
MTTTDETDFATARMWAERHGLRDIRQNGKFIPADYVLLTNGEWVSRDEAVRIMGEHRARAADALRNTVRSHRDSIKHAEAELREKNRAVADCHAELAKLDTSDSAAVRDAARQLTVAVNNRDGLVGHLTGTRALLEVAEEQLAATSKDN